MTAARNSLANEEWNNAERQAEAALLVRADAVAAKELLNKAHRGRQDQANYQKAVSEAHDALATENWAMAEMHANTALGLRMGDATARDFLNTARKRKRIQADYENALSAA